jgi:integrase
LDVDIGQIQGIVRATAPPVVLTRAEVSAVLAELSGTFNLLVALLFGSRLRLQETLNVRVKDIDMERRQIVVRQGKGRKDRVTMLPSSVAARLALHLDRVRQQHQSDIDKGFGRAPLPDALVRKYPNTDRQWATEARAEDRALVDEDDRYGLTSDCYGRWLAARCASHAAESRTLDVGRASFMK